eukprot:scaffold2893_cov254-Pinguiococcus_pyrenoidosus.AAC.26
MIGRRLQSALADKATAYGVTTNVIITNLLINFGVFLACALIFALSKARPSLRYRATACQGSQAKILLVVDGDIAAILQESILSADVLLSQRHSARTVELASAAMDVLCQVSGETRRVSPHTPPISVSICCFRALPEDVFMKKIGLDALMFVKTNACLARSLSLSALIGCFVLVPVNTSFGYIRANVHSGGTSFAQYTIANVSEQSSVFYIHVLAAYLVTFVSMTGLRNLYLEYVQLRHLHLLSRWVALTVIAFVSPPVRGVYGGALHA